MTLLEHAATPGFRHEEQSAPPTAHIIAMAALILGLTILASAGGLMITKADTTIAALKNCADAGKDAHLTKSKTVTCLEQPNSIRVARP